MLYFIFLLIATVGLQFVLKMLTVAPWVYALFNWPGTFLHEAAHYGTALLLQGHPETFSIFPTINSDWSIQTLGHVTFYPNSWNAATISLAPLFLFPLSFFFIWRASKHRKFSRVFFYLYLGACCWLSCWPSPADWKIAMEHPFSFALFIFLIFLILKSLHVLKMRIIRSLPMSV
jgi:hypothetical protein